MNKIKSFQSKTFLPLKLFFLNSNYGGGGANVLTLPQFSILI